MKGTRPLDNDDIRRVSRCFTGTFEVRNYGLFMLGISIGGRISVLNLRIAEEIDEKYSQQGPILLPSILYPIIFSTGSIRASCLVFSAFCNVQNP